MVRGGKDWDGIAQRKRKENSNRKHGLEGEVTEGPDVSLRKLRAERTIWIF